MPIDVRTDGRWSGGGGAVVALFEQAQREYPDVLTVDRGNGLPLYLRNALPPQALLTDYLVLPQNAWPWTPWHGTGRVHLRWAALRAASWAALRRARGVIRISSAIPAPVGSRTLPVIPNVLDSGFEEALSAATPRRSWVDAAAGNFLSVGSVTPYRNYHRLLEAHDRYRRAGGTRDLVVVGPAISRRLQTALLEQARAAAASGSVKVVFEHQPRDQVLAAMARCAGLILPSLVEASPMTLLEAMACGAPVAASRIAGHVETAGDAAAAVAWIDPHDVGDIAAGLRQLEEAAEPTPHVRADWRAQQRHDWAARMVGLLQTLAGTPTAPTD